MQFSVFLVSRFLPYLYELREAGGPNIDPPQSVTSIQHYSTFIIRIPYIYSVILHYIRSTKVLPSLSCYL